MGEFRYYPYHNLCLLINRCTHENVSSILCGVEKIIACDDFTYASGSSFSKGG